MVNAALTPAIIARLGVADTSENGFALGWDEIKLPNPVFEGDTIYSEREVLHKRESRSKPQWGIVRFRSRGIKHDGTVVMDYTRSVMVWKRSSLHGATSSLQPATPRTGTPPVAEPIVLKRNAPAVQAGQGSPMHNLVLTVLTRGILRWLPHPLILRLLPHPLILRLLPHPLILSLSKEELGADRGLPTAQWSNGGPPRA